MAGSDLLPAALGLLLGIPTVAWLRRHPRLNPVDGLLGGYVAFLSGLILGRGNALTTAGVSMLAMHALFLGMLALFARLEPPGRIARFLHDLYPIFMLLPFYAQIGLLNPPAGDPGVFANDALIQRWEEVVFGGQISYTWIRAAPSVFWSAVLHLAYFAYYPIIVSGPLLLWLRGDRAGARSILLPMMIAFVVCYLFFVLFPVAGPYYAFDQPAGPVREVWSAHLVYGLLEGGSSFGAAFPSSHVAATVAATVAGGYAWRPLGLAFAVPCGLLIIGTVYCQQHYGIDASAGLAVGLLAVGAARRWTAPSVVRVPVPAAG